MPLHRLQSALVRRFTDERPGQGIPLAVERGQLAVAYAGNRNAFTKDSIII